MKKIFNKKILIIFSGMIVFTLLFLLSGQKKIITVENRSEPQVKAETSQAEDQPENKDKEEAVLEGEKKDNKPSLETTKEKIEQEDKIEDVDEKVDADKEEEDSDIEDELINWGFSSGRNQEVDTVIIHTVYNKLGGDRYDLDKILNIFKDYGVAPHYIIDRSGQIRQLVSEKNTAYHAGESRMPDGRKGVNDFSIGIEIINAEDDEPTKAQYKSLESLVDGIDRRYNIKYILGHSDVAEGRKTDPWNFDWDRGVEKRK